MNDAREAIRQSGGKFSFCLEILHPKFKLRPENLNFSRRVVTFSAESGPFRPIWTAESAHSPPKSPQRVPRKAASAQARAQGVTNNAFPVFYSMQGRFRA